MRAAGGWQAFVWPDVRLDGLAAVLDGLAAVLWLQQHVLPHALVCVDPRQNTTIDCIPLVWSFGGADLHLGRHLSPTLFAPTAPVLPPPPPPHPHPTPPTLPPTQPLHTQPRQILVAGWPEALVPELQEGFSMFTPQGSNITFLLTKVCEGVGGGEGGVCSVWCTTSHAEALQ
jgi:hypothetical protein